MEKRTLGKTGMDATVLGYGGAEIGFRSTPFETVERMINGALDAGLNVIDTADCYVDSEQKIGRAVSGRLDDYFLFTTVSHSKDSAHWNPEEKAQTIYRRPEHLR